MTNYRIEISPLPKWRDARGTGVAGQIEQLFSFKVREVRVRDVYTISADISSQEAEKLALGEEWQPVEGGEDLVLTTKTGGPVRGLNVAETLNNYVKKINKKEELQAAKEHREPIFFERITPHTLRHTFASYHLSHFRSYAELQVEIGHRDATLLRTRYLCMNGVHASPLFWTE